MEVDFFLKLFLQMLQLRGRQRVRPCVPTEPIAHTFFLSWEKALFASRWGGSVLVHVSFLAFCVYWYWRLTG